MARIKYVQIENKNALIELLEEGRPIEKIFIATNAYKDPKTQHIQELANKAGIETEKLSRRRITRRSKSSSKESVIGLMRAENQMELGELLTQLFESGKEPFILIFNDLRYAQNVGAIFRTAFAAGVNGVIVPVEKGNLLNDEIIRISMGTCLRIPIVEMNIFAALKVLQKNAIHIVALDMEGEALYKTDLTGAKALMLGSEDIGVSSKLLERVDSKISIPMEPGLGSLNVSVAAAVVLYEKYRQTLAGRA